MYGLRKFHKDPTNSCPPFRPILSVVNTPMYNLAKFLIPILEPITITRLSTRIVFRFVKILINKIPHIFGHHLMWKLYFLITHSMRLLKYALINKLYPKINMEINGLRKNEN